MAKTVKRTDGLYQKNMVIGRNDDGSYQRKTVYAKTKKELDIRCSEITQQVYQGVYVAEDKTTFGAMAELWLTQANPTANQHWIERQEGVLRCHLLPALKNMKLKELKTYHLQDIINAMAKGGAATSTMSKVKQTAARILKLALEHDLIVRNVFDSVKVPSIEPDERRALTDEEKALLTRTWREHRVGLGAMIMMYCGLRRGELLALRWENIDFESKVLSVRKAIAMEHNHPVLKSPKSKAGVRDIPIPNLLCEILQEAPRESQFVCPSAQGKLMSETAWRRAWDGYQHFLNLAAGGKDGCGKRPRMQVIDNITAHMLRHTYATILYDAGVDIKSAQKFLGHANLEMTLAVYTHLSEAKKMEAVNTLNAHLDKQLSLIIITPETPSDGDVN